LLWVSFVGSNLKMKRMLMQACIYNLNNDCICLKEIGYINRLSKKTKKTALAKKKKKYFFSVTPLPFFFFFISRCSYFLFKFLAFCIQSEFPWYISQPFRMQ